MIDAWILKNRPYEKTLMGSSQLFFDAHWRHYYPRLDLEAFFNSIELPKVGKVRDSRKDYELAAMDLYSRRELVIPVCPPQFNCPRKQPS